MYKLVFFNLLYYEKKESLMKKYKVAILIGRFQAPRLHYGYAHVLIEGLKLADQTAVVICSAYRLGTKTDPLTFADRRHMFKKQFRHSKSLPVAYMSLDDVATNEEWSENLDAVIKKTFPSYDTEDVVLLHSRDSFKPYYSGRYKTQFIEEPLGSYNSTSIRKATKSSPSASARAAKVALTQAQKYPRIDVAVDIAVLDYDTEKKKSVILLGRKKNQTKWCLPGGFFDVKDNSLENAALRELQEETNIEGNPEYLEHIGSQLVNDWRYKGEDKLLTNIYLYYGNFEHLSKVMKAQDDLVEIKTFELDESLLKIVTDNHKSLIEKILNHA